MVSLRGDRLAARRHDSDLSLNDALDEPVQLGPLNELGVQ